jgi:gentisate 1,2-dioxygenase
MSAQNDVWEEVERRVVQMLGKGDALAALKDLDTFLAKGPPSASACAALSYRAIAKEEIDDLPGALEDQQQAHALTEPGTYSRYTLELSLGSQLAMTGKHEQAFSWLRAALKTVLEGNGVSGGVALRRFLELSGGEAALKPEDRVLCVDVARRSWRVLRQSGEPDPTNLARSAEFLIECGARASRE